MRLFRTQAHRAARSAAPQEVTLTFTDTLEAAFSKVTVTDANGTEVSQGKGASKRQRDACNPKTLERGYLQRRAVSTDTHKTEGNFAFSVKWEGQPTASRRPGPPLKRPAITETHSASGTNHSLLN